MEMDRDFGRSQLLPGQELQEVSFSFSNALLGTLFRWPGLLNPPLAGLWGLWKSA